MHVRRDRRTTASDASTSVMALAIDECFELDPKFKIECRGGGKMDGSELGSEIF